MDKADKKFQRQEVLLVLDNRSIHKSKEVMQKLKQISNKVTYPPIHLNLLQLNCDFRRSKEI